MATLYVRVESWWRQVGGFLWWRRWSEPAELVHGFLEMVGGGFDDFTVDAEDLADELADWNRDRFAYRGETFRVRWLDDATSSTLRTEVFGMDEDSV